MAGNLTYGLASAEARDWAKDAAENPSSTRKSPATSEWYPRPPSRPSQLSSSWCPRTNPGATKQRERARCMLSTMSPPHTLSHFELPTLREGRPPPPRLRSPASLRSSQEGERCAWCHRPILMHHTSTDIIARASGATERIVANKYQASDRLRLAAEEICSRCLASTSLSQAVATGCAAPWRASEILTPFPGPHRCMRWRLSRCSGQTRATSNASERDLRRPPASRAHRGGPDDKI